MTDKKNIKTIQIYQNRLASVKKILESEKVKTLKPLKKLGGSSVFYSIMTNKGIISKEDGFYMWNESIPVTFKLAETVYKDVTGYYAKNKVDESKVEANTKSNSESSEQENVAMKHMDIMTNVINSGAFEKLYQHLYNYLNLEKIQESNFDTLKTVKQNNIFLEGIKTDIEKLKDTVNDKPLEPVSKKEDITLKMFDDPLFQDEKCHSTKSGKESEAVDTVVFEKKDTYSKGWSILWGLISFNKSSEKIS